MRAGLNAPVCRDEGETDAGEASGALQRATCVWSDVVAAEEAVVGVVAVSAGVELDCYCGGGGGEGEEDGEVLHFGWVGGWEYGSV